MWEVKPLSLKPCKNVFAINRNLSAPKLVNCDL